MSLVVTDAVNRVLGVALDGLSTRQDVTANNIANVDTPNFRATGVDFEDSLRQAVDNGDFSDARTGDVTIQTAATDTPVGANGNNVDLRTETLTAMQTQFQYQTVSRALSDRFTIVKDSIGAGA